MATFLPIGEKQRHHLVAGLPASHPSTYGNNFTGAVRHRNTPVAYRQPAVCNQQVVIVQRASVPAHTNLALSRLACRGIQRIQLYSDTSIQRIHYTPSYSIPLAASRGRRCLLAARRRPSQSDDAWTRARRTPRPRPRTATELPTVQTLRQQAVPAYSPVLPALLPTIGVSSPLSIPGRTRQAAGDPTGLLSDALRRRLWHITRHANAHVCMCVCVVPTRRSRRPQPKVGRRSSRGRSRLSCPDPAHRPAPVSRIGRESPTHSGRPGRSAPDSLRRANPGLRRHATAAPTLGPSLRMASGPPGTTRSGTSCSTPAQRRSRTSAQHRHGASFSTP